MRICSFLPSATEILYELGLGDSVVGVTHECDFPADAVNKTIVVRSAFDASRLDSEEINSLVVQYVRDGKDIYIVDDEALKRLNPDLIVAQGLCEVCSPHMKELDRALKILDNTPQVVVLDPRNLGGIMRSIEQVARIVGKEARAREVVGSLGKRIECIRSVVRGVERPKVLCLEWFDPIFTAGHWVPEIVEIAGGVNGVGKKDEPSRVMKWDEASMFNPDILVVMPCGFDIERTMKELWRIEKRKEWNELTAVKNKQVYVVDANSYFSRPGPRTVIGLEILAKIIHPVVFKDLSVPEGSFRRAY